MYRPNRWVFAALAVLAAANLGIAQTFNFSLDGLQEVPPNASPASGSCTVVVDDILDNLDVSCTYLGMLGTVSAAHIHAPAPPGVNAPVILPLAPLGSPNGTINHTDLPLSQTNINHILAGNAYVNIHTQAFPGGEIRGQIVPEPVALGSILLGGFLLMMRRRTE